MNTHNITVNKQEASLVITEENGASVTVSPSIVSSIALIGAGPQGPPGDGVAGNNDLGVIFLKDNAVSTVIPSVNARAVVAGAMLTGELYNFVKDSGTNSLKYEGAGGLFHIVASFNFFEGSQKTCGFYIGVSKNASNPLDPNGDRISESEIYVNASTPSNQPQSATVQTVIALEEGDRVFFIVQNKDSTGSITVQFLKLIVVPLTSERGAAGPKSITIAEPLSGDEFTLFHTKEPTTLSQVLAVVRGTSPSVSYELRYAADRSDLGTLAIEPAIVTSTSVGDTATIQNMPIPSNSYVWLSIATVSGDTTEFNLSVAF